MNKEPDRRKGARRQKDRDLLMEAQICRNENDIQSLMEKLENHKALMNGKFSGYEKTMVGFLISLIFLLLSILGTILFYLAKS